MLTFPPNTGLVLAGMNLTVSDTGVPMKTDRVTKALLLAIAIGLWLNVMANWLRPKDLYAQSDMYLPSIDRYVKQIANGICTNAKIC